MSRTGRRSARGRSKSCSAQNSRRIRIAASGRCVTCSSILEIDEGICDTEGIDTAHDAMPLDEVHHRSRAPQRGRSPEHSIWGVGAKHNAPMRTGPQQPHYPAIDLSTGLSNRAARVMRSRAPMITHPRSDASPNRVAIIGTMSPARRSARPSQFAEAMERQVHLLRLPVSPASTCRLHLQYQLVSWTPSIASSSASTRSLRTS